MAKFFSELDQTLIKFISEQKIFFTATAPQQGRVNLSPKGMDTFRCLDIHTVAYLDLTGSGNETAAHLAENGRITMMFCSFTGKPLILRLYGKGEVILPRNPKWNSYLAHFNSIPGQRQIIVLKIESVQTSCGFAVPRMEFVEERQMLRDYAEKKGPEGLERYRQEKNTCSIDGLPTHLLED